MTLETLLDTISLAPRDDIASIAACAVLRAIDDGCGREFLKALDSLNSKYAVDELAAQCEQWQSED